ncbi:MAG: hypothetical protein ACTHN0_02145 [Aquihabitans sp.]
MTAVAQAPGTATDVARRPRFWSRAPGWIFHVTCAVGGFLLLWSASYPLGGFLPFLASFWLLAGCVVAWLVRLVSYLAARTTPGPRPRFWPFLIAPVGAVVVIAIALTSAPFDLRWGLSEGAFDHRADQMAARAQVVGGGRSRPLVRNDRVGLYQVRDGWVDRSGNVYFTIEGSGFIDTVGLVRIEGEVPPPGYERDEFSPIGGGWYTFVQPF